MAEVAPLTRQMEEEGRIPPELVKTLAQYGFFGVVVPEQFGGSGQGFFDVALTVEALARADAAVALLVDVHNTLITGAINRFGLPEPTFPAAAATGRGTDRRLLALGSARGQRRLRAQNHRDAGRGGIPAQRFEGLGVGGPGGGALPALRPARSGSRGQVPRRDHRLPGGPREFRPDRGPRPRQRSASRPRAPRHCSSRTASSPRMTFWARSATDGGSPWRSSTRGGSGLPPSSSGSDRRRSTWPSPTRKRGKRSAAESARTSRSPSPGGRRHAGGDRAPPDLECGEAGGPGERHALRGGDGQADGPAHGRIGHLARNRDPRRRGYTTDCLAEKLWRDAKAGTIYEAPRTCSSPRSPTASTSDRAGFGYLRRECPRKAAGRSASNPENARPCR